MTTLGNGTGPRGRQPTGMRVAPTSYRKLEEAAATLSPVLPKVKGHKHMIDGWRVLERTLSTAGFEPHIEHERELVDCAAFTIPDRGLVVLRRDVYDGLFTGSVFSRSTVVHEMAHIALAHHVTLHRGAAGPHRFFEDSEWQAKAMTAAVMMPIEVCRLARGADELAAMCGTSVEAANYRLERLVKERIIPPKR